MFEIGTSLREARARRQIPLGQAEQATKIRGKYLRALEEERFDLLPSDTYVKGFLRTYADYLGLDGQLYVDEYNSRFVIGDEWGRRRRSRTAAGREAERRVQTNVVLIALGAIAVLTVIVISAWKAGGGGDNPSSTPPAKTTVTKPHAPAPLLMLTGLRGSTHVAARVGSATGDIAYDGTVQQGDDPVAVRGHRLWVQIDAPEDLKIQVRGKTVHVPGSRPRVIIVTPTGWRPA